MLLLSRVHILHSLSGGQGCRTDSAEAVSRDALGVHWDSSGFGTKPGWNTSPGRLLHILTRQPSFNLHVFSGIWLWEHKDVWISYKEMVPGMQWSLHWKLLHGYLICRFISSWQMTTNLTSFRCNDKTKWQSRGLNTGMVTSPRTRFVLEVLFFNLSLFKYGHTISGQIWELIYWCIIFEIISLYKMIQAK